MAYYDDISKGYDELYKEEQSKKLAIIKSSISMDKNARMLDIGCGTGLSSQFNCRVIGVDPSIELIKQNKCHKVLGIAELLPFKDNSFDYVVSVTAVHNFEDIKKAVKEIKRVCSGKFVLTVLKKSRKFDFIKNIIKKNFKIEEEVEEEKDAIFFCSRQQNRKVYI